MTPLLPTTTNHHLYTITARSSSLPLQPPYTLVITRYTTERDGETPRSIAAAAKADVDDLVRLNKARHKNLTANSKLMVRAAGLVVGWWLVNRVMIVVTGDSGGDGGAAAAAACCCYWSLVAAVVVVVAMVVVVVVTPYCP
jgi:hypothetical protein